MNLITVTLLLLAAGHPLNVWYHCRRGWIQDTSVADPGKSVTIKLMSANNDPDEVESVIEHVQCDMSKQKTYLQVTDLWYRNDPTFSDIYAWANSEDPDQSAPISGYAVCHSVCIVWTHYSVVEWLQQMFWVSEYLGNIRYLFTSGIFSFQETRSLKRKFNHTTFCRD